MLCPECQSASRVIDSRNKPEYLYRRRECLECGERFTTHETLIITRKGVKIEMSVADELEKLIQEQAKDAKTARVWSVSLDKPDRYGRSLYDIREGYGD